MTPRDRTDDADALTDQRLMAEVNANDIGAFEALYDRYADRAYRVALSICHDKSLAEDAVQNAFLAIWGSRASYCEQRGTVAAWLLTVVYRRAIDVARSNGKHAAPRADAAQRDARVASDDVAETVERRSDTGGLRQQLESLPDPQREVIVLAFYGGLSHAEIADRLHLPNGTVKGRVRLGLQKLRADVDRASG